MKQNRNYIPIIAPALIAIALVLGILIGIRVSDNTKGIAAFNIYSNNKIDFLLNYITDEYVDSISEKDLIEKSIPSILKELDPHSVYISKQEFTTANEPLEGNFSGIGITFNVENDTVVVINTIPNGPSEHVGILAGDRIIKVDGENIAGIKFPSDSIVKKLKGPTGTVVKVCIKRMGTDKPIDFKITRGRIPLYSVDVAYMINESTGFIRISKFSKTTYDEFETAVKDMQSKGMTKLIIDLRDNNGGYLDAAVKIADQFLSDGTMIVYTEGRNAGRNNFYASDEGMCKKTKVAVLINEFSASASEILAGALQDNDRGIILGRRSFGKGLVQEQRTFRDGSAVRLTVARYFTPSGRCIQKPYDEDIEKYYNEIASRYNNGEYFNKINPNKNDTSKYYTSNGNIVYGGGGISPDIFVAVDTIKMNSLFFKLRNAGLMYSFAFDYADKNREKLILFKEGKELNEYLVKVNVLSRFLSFAKKNGVTWSGKELYDTREILSTHLNASIARNILNNKGYYTIIQDADSYIDTALTILD